MTRARILGIDPGSRQTGYALATFSGREVSDLVIGTWKTKPRVDRAEGLGALSQAIEAWIGQHEIDVAVVESLFHHKNVRSALVLAEARGALLAALGRTGIPVREYPPATVKKAICGFGAATKDQIRRALSRTVPGVRRFDLDALPSDATDALAVAVCHQIHARHESLLERSGR